MAGRLKECGPALDMDPAILRWMLHFMVRHRRTAKIRISLAGTYKFNLPRIELEDFEEVVNLAKVSEVMES